MAFDPNWENKNLSSSNLLRNLLNQCQQDFDSIRNEKDEQFTLVYDLTKQLRDTEQQIKLIRQMLQQSESHLHSISKLETYLSNYKIMQIHKISENEPIDAYPDLKALRTTIFALTKTDLQQAFVFTEQKEESQGLNASLSIEKKSPTSSIAEHQALIKTYLGNTHFVSSMPGGLNSTKIVDSIPFPIKSAWTKYFDLNQKASTFQSSERCNIAAEIIYLSFDHELLVALSNGHVMYAPVQDIAQIIILNQRCCHEAYIYAINLEHGEAVSGTLHWNKGWKMINLKKKLGQDIYMAWAMCSTCEQIKNENW